MRSPRRSILKLARRGPVRASDLHERGWPRDWLLRLERKGELVRVSRGLYRAADANPTEHAALVEVAKRVPNAVIGLLTALQYHGLTTAAPQAVWVVIPRTARTPRLDYPRLHVVRASGAAATHGIETNRIEGVRVRVTSAAKTVADCFRYRDHVGLETALEALRAYMGRSRRGTSIDALVEACRADQVLSVVRPYLEAVA